MNTGFIDFFSFIGTPLGMIMYGIYSIVPNYGMTLLVFTIILKIAMLPLAIKQQKGLIANAKIHPKMMAIQKAYANNKQKQGEEMQKLYAKEKYSPLSSCLPMLIQFPILFGMLDVIYKPIKHMLQLPAEVVEKAIGIATLVLGESGMNSYSREISVLSAVKQDPAAFIQGLGAEVTSQLSNFDFTMFGISLGDLPTLTPAGKSMGLYLGLLMIPILSGLSSLILSLATQKSNPAMEGQGAGMTKSMMLMMPAMSIWISFIVPAGVGVYWLMSNIVTLLQTLILNKIMNPREAAAKAKAEEEEEHEQERLARIEAKKKAKESGKAEIDESVLSQKEANRRKLAEARRRDAEKYGEQYVEVTDEDVK